MAAAESLHMQKWLQNGAISSFGAGDCALGVGPFNAKPFGAGQPAFYVSDFFDPTENVLIPDGLSRLSRAQLQQQLVNRKSLVAPSEWEQPDWKQFQLDFQEIQLKIQNGDLKKVVPVVFESIPLQVTPEILAGWLWHGLTSSTRGALFGYWNLQKSEGILGLTPEVLFSLEGQSLTTMALAGTARDQNHQLLKDSKERFEHDLVVQEIKARLSPLGHVKTSGPYEWTPGALTHLRTDISVELEDSNLSAVDLVQNLHPTPALGGAPRQASIDWLKNHDCPPGRGPFGSPFGFLSGSSANFVVAIRCLIWRDGKVYIGSGCGIVEDSQVEREWQELKLKRQAVRQVFGWA